MSLRCGRGDTGVGCVADSRAPGGTDDALLGMAGFRDLSKSWSLGASSELRGSSSLVEEAEAIHISQKSTDDSSVRGFEPHTIRRPKPKDK